MNPTMARIKDESVEKYGCLRYNKQPWSFPCTWGKVVYVGELADGTYVAGPLKNYQAWLDARKRSNN
jgi:hypothetical protein